MVQWLASKIPKRHEFEYAALQFLYLFQTTAAYLVIAASHILFLISLIFVFNLLKIKDKVGAITI